MPDPRASARPEDFAAQFAFVKSCADKLSEIHTTIEQIRQVRDQLKSLEERLPKEERLQVLRDTIKVLKEAMTKVEETLYQTKNRSSQDPLNFPVRLNDQLGHVMEIAAQGDFPPTTQAVAVRDLLFERIDAQLERWRAIQTNRLPNLNRQIRQLEVDIIGVKAKN